MSPAEGTTFERFGGKKEVDAVEALLTGYATDNDIVKEASFLAFINGDRLVPTTGRDAISRLAQVDPWAAAEFTFNLMAESRNSHNGISDRLRGLRPSGCWDMAATSLPHISDEATHELAKGFCVLMDEDEIERKCNHMIILAQCSNVAASALRNDCSPETVQLLVHRGVKAIQNDDEFFVDLIRLPGDRYHLTSYWFSNLLDITKTAGVVDSKEDRDYLTSILGRVLSRLNSEEVKYCIPEIIDTYLALGNAGQQTISEALSQNLKVEEIADLNNTNEATLLEIAKRYRDEQYECSDPSPKHYKTNLPTETQLFWPGDVVEVSDTPGFVNSSLDQSVHMESQQTIKDISYFVNPQPKTENERYYDTENRVSQRADSLHLIERGELWKYCHGEITEFTDPKSAYDYAMRAVDYQFVKKRDLPEKNKSDFSQEEYQRWYRESFLEAVELGYADSLGEESRIFEGECDEVVLKFNDPKISALIANSTLADFGRRTRQVVDPS